jgi:hypothetical protein
MAGLCVPLSNASPATSRPPAHDSGSGWTATPFQCGSFVRYSMPVLIPALSLRPLFRSFSPTTGRFSQGAMESVKSFQKLGAKLVIPYFYIEECATHLLGALAYQTGAEEFQGDFAFSQNGYVSHYYQLRLAGIRVPDSIKEFLATIAPSARRPQDDKGFWNRKVMSELEVLFRDYGITFEFIRPLPEHYRKDVESEYAYALHKLRRSKHPLLVEHDVLQLGHCRREIVERGETRMCLTWDGAMISVGRKLRDCGWIVSPHEAVDFVQPFLRLSESKLLSLAHGLASVRERPREISARILDRVVQLAGERFLDREFRKRIAAKSS